MELSNCFSNLHSRHRTSLILILGLLFSGLLLFTLFVVHQERSLLIQSELEERSHNFSNNIYETLRISVENLQASSTVMVFFENISLKQFNAITARYFSTDPGLMIVEWQPIVPESERSKFVSDMQRNGLPNFRFWEPNSEGLPIKAKARDIHVPVVFMSSRDQSQNDVNTLGLDLAWSPERMMSKLDARDLGRAQSSTLFNIVTGTSNGYAPLGFAITLPVYSNGIVPDSIDERRSKIVGYMAGVYALERLIEKNIAELVSEGVSIDIHDELDNKHRLIKSAGENTEFSDEVILDAFGNRLHIQITATKRFVSASFQAAWVLLPLLVLISGALTISFIHQLGNKADSLAVARNELEVLNAKLTELSRRDSLTNLYNRRAFLEYLSDELQRLNRHKQTVALLMLDLDLFKNVNDKWGHPVGDDVLQNFAEACLKCSRNIDVIGRIGGEEFAILLTNSSEEQAVLFAERLRSSVSELTIPIRNHSDSLGITVSIGITITDQPIPVNQILEQADKALYEAKRSGRNIVKLFG